MHNRSGKKGNTSAGQTKPVFEVHEEKPERIAKVMARAGLCSRREAEAWISAGRVSVNEKKLTTPAFTVTIKDKVKVDGKPLPVRERTRLWLFHKAAGTVTTNKDPDGRKTIFDELPEELPRLLTIGRLDINTEGLLLMTNDGGLARELELPSTGWLRRYRVRVHGKVDQEALAKLEDGIAVDGVLYGAIHAELERVQGSNSWLMVSLREGKNREIKNVLGALGLEVTRLIRVSYGPFQLGDLPVKAIREVRSRTLRDQLGKGLAERAGADFEGPIIHQAPDIARSASKASRMNADKKQKKTKRGTVREETLSRLTTKKKAKSIGTRGRKPGSGNTTKRDVNGRSRPGTRN